MATQHAALTTPCAMRHASCAATSELHIQGQSRFSGQDQPPLMQGVLRLINKWHNQLQRMGCTAMQSDLINVRGPPALQRLVLGFEVSR